MDKPLWPISITLQSATGAHKVATLLSQEQAWYGESSSVAMVQNTSLCFIVIKDVSCLVH